jgi:hypothetical protein
MVFPVRSILFLAVMGGLLAGCSASDQTTPAAVTLNGQSKALPSVFRTPVPTRGASTIASLPDRGSLMAYAAVPARHEGASTWHAVQLSEAHALRAISEGGMVINAPDGRPIRLKYERHVEHPDGNWTWVGRLDGRKDGPEAILTFGPKAVFGSIPNGAAPDLQIQMAAGRTWLVETDATKLAASGQSADSTADFVKAHAGQASTVAASSHRMTAAGAGKASTEALTSTASNAFVDIVLGYTSAFAARLGGQSQAVTRLNFLVDTANQAYANSQVGGRLRLVHTVEVDYPDATLNRTALFELTGMQCNAVPLGSVHLPDSDANCSAGTVPAGLQPLVQAREQFGADLVSLVRIYSTPENGSCGVAWLIGGGQETVSAGDSAFGYSVVSDSSGGTGSTCRDLTLAHEVGHNLGLAHDSVSAAGTDDTNTDANPLDPEEYGRYAFSFGYSTDADHGNFYTIMSLPGAGQRAYSVFSNPRITSCGGLACGDAATADNARTLNLTMPVVASFRATRTQFAATARRGDFNGDGKADLFWRNTATGANSIWLSANAANYQAARSVTDTAWVVAGVGDFNGDGKSDLFWRNTSTGSDSIWLSADANKYQASEARDLDWSVAGVADFTGDGKADILWRNSNTGANQIWRSGSSASTQAVQSVTDTTWVVAAVADFNGDGKADIFWRNTLTGSNSIWRSASASSYVAASPVTDTNWVAAGAGDFNGDGKADLFWRNSSTGANAVWLSANKGTPMSVNSVTDTHWTVSGIGDFGGDHKADILWRQSSTGSNVIWKSASKATSQSVKSVTDVRWIVAG